MSLLSLGALSIGRDLADSGTAIAKDTSVRRRSLPPAPTDGSALTSPPPSPPSAGGPPAAKPGGDVASFGQLLVAQIPSEALLAYTTLLALFSTAGSNYKTGRWVLYVASIVVCAAVVLSSYYAQRDYGFDNRPKPASTPAQAAPVQGGAPAAPPAAPTSTKSDPNAAQALHLPIFPTVTAVVAMAVYGLTVPGSPLQYEISSSAFGISAGCLAVGGGVIMSIFAPFLGRGNGATPVAKPVAAKT